MVVDGKPVALTTGVNVEDMKDKLFYGYFHLPDPKKTTVTKSWGSTKKKRRRRRS